MTDLPTVMRRRDLLAGGVGLGTLAAFPAWAQNHGHGLSPRVELQGPEITLTVGRQHMMIDGKPYHAIGINGSAPAPLIRLREGQRARITVVNTLDEETSIHWHGLLLPFQMDGVPGISFPGIPAGGRFTYEFPVVQAGTYWYHRPYIDPDRIGIWGWSGGGAMTQNALFRYPDLYKTGIAVAGPTDMKLYDTVYQERYMGLPQDNAEGYKNGSPITFADRLKGNLLLIHGTLDDNVHYQNQDQLVDRLIHFNKPFTMMAYPDRSHGIYEGENTSIHLYSLMTRYLETNLPPGGR